MVTIIDGEIVQDSDPRAQAYRQRNRRPESSNDQRGGREQGSFSSSTQRANNGPNFLGQGSILDQFNNKLLAAGFPRWNIGQHVVEPIVSVILLLALVFVGVKGLMVVMIIWFILRRSRQGI